MKRDLYDTKAGMKFIQMKYFEECNYLGMLNQERYILNMNHLANIAFSVTGKYLHSLAHAATGYHKVLEENRKLYNQVQDLKGN